MTTRVLPLCSALLLAALPLPAAGQHSRAGDDAPPRVGWVPREILERPTTLQRGVGPLHDPVTTRSPEAQALYDQGTAYLHSYVWIEAARSFHQALRHDSTLALAHVGLSRVYSGLSDPAAAVAALATARRLAAGTSERERRRIELRALQLESMADWRSPEKLRAYKAALDEALARHPEDAELWLLRGNVEEPGGAGGRGQRGTAASVPFYERALALVPGGHFAAHHYLVHSNEHLVRFDRAVEHGRVYARLASAVPHAHHMLAHDLMKTGRLREAVARFAVADSLEHAYYGAERVSRDLDWHHPHNQNLLAMAYQHQGRVRDAERVLRSVRSMTPRLEAAEPAHFKDLPELLLARGRVREALAEGEAMTRGKAALTRASGHAFAARALVALGRAEKAGPHLEAAKRELDAGSGNFYAELVAPQVHLALAEYLLRTGWRREGVTILDELQRASRQATGPDAWIEALFRLEAVARVAREAGEWEVADAAARRLLEHDAAYAGSHFARALVARHRGDRAAAARAYAEAARLWADADADLPELREARRRSAATPPAPAPGR